MRKTSLIFLGAVAGAVATLLATQPHSMLIGSAADTGSNSRVDMYVEMIREIAGRHKLAPFRLGYFYSEVSKNLIRKRIAAGETVAGLNGRADLTLAELDATDRIVAMAGIHPYNALLDRGADVIIGGRSSDLAICAAVPQAAKTLQAALDHWQDCEAEMREVYRLLNYRQLSRVFHLV